MTKKRKAASLLVAAVFCFVLASYLQAREKDSLWVTLITMVYAVTPAEDIPELDFLAYVPIITADSIPVFIKLSDEAKYNSHVIGFTFKTIRGDGNLLRATLKDLKKDVSYLLAFDTYTLKKLDNREDLPEFVPLASYSRLTDELEYYTQSSLTVQSSDPLIQAKAYEILYSTWTGNVRKALEKIVKFTGEGITFKALGDQTALATLKRGYAVCTGKANLAAALARTLGIPARILLVLPSHFIVEFWIPDYGWVRGESTRGLFPEPRHIWTVDWVGSIEDENLFGPSLGIIAYLGIEGNGAASWFQENDEIALPEHFIQPYAVVDGDIVRNDLLFAGGADLWRLFCQVQNSGLEDSRSSLFRACHGEYFQSLLENDIENAIVWANLAIEEGKRLISFKKTERPSELSKDKERIHEKSRLPDRRPHPY
jgi:transglutaminase-like putative cysteine protease